MKKAEQNSGRSHRLQFTRDSVVVPMFGSEPNLERSFIIDSRGSEWADYLSDRLNALCKLEENWDGYGSVPVTFENARKCFDILNGLKNQLAHSKSGIQSLIKDPPFMVPVSGGAMQAEWHLGKNYIELFFDEPAQVRLFAYDEDSDWEFEAEIDTSGYQMNLTSIVECFKLIHSNEAEHVERATA